MYKYCEICLVNLGFINASIINDFLYTERDNFLGVSQNL